MSPTPGAFAPTVTQWVAGAPSSDAYGNEVPTFTSRTIRVLAEYPAGSGNQASSSERDNGAGDLLSTDRGLLLTPDTAVSELDEFTISDGLRYRVNGAPALYRSPFTGTAVTQVNLRRIS